MALLFHGVPRCLAVVTAIVFCLLGASLPLGRRSVMVHTRSTAGRLKRKYRALELGFAPSVERSVSGPPVFYGGTYESPPPVFYGVESSNPSERRHTFSPPGNDYFLGLPTVPPPPFGFHGLFSWPAPPVKTSAKVRRSGL